MDKEQILKIIKDLKGKSKKRKFKQTFDLVLNFKGLDLKKPEHKIDAYTTLPYGKGKSVKICALVDVELSTQAKEACDKVILKSEFLKWANKKELKKLAKEFDYFIAQASIMPQVAATFGKTLGPVGKMPNPKAGCIIPPKAALKPICEKLRKTIRIATKNEPAVKAMVGNEEMKDEEIAENINTIYNTVLHLLPQEKANIKNVLLKLTMSKPLNMQKTEEAGEK